MSTQNNPALDAPSLLAPLAPLYDNERSSHVVQFYSEDGSLLDGLSRFIGTALGAGDAAVAICTKAHRDGLTRRLKARGFDTNTAVTQGRLVLLDAAETLSKFMIGDVPDAELFREVIGEVLNRARAVAEGENPRVVAFGEMVALLWAQGKPETAIRLEELWNELAETQSFSLRCAYPLRAFNRGDHSELFLKICCKHSGVIPSESYTGLATDEDRLSNISQLQQKAQALETEVAERRRAEQALRERESQLGEAKQELERMVEQRTAALRRLSAQVLGLQDSERRRVARELHDGLGQYFAILKLNIDMLRQSPERGDLWQQSEELMEHCISEIRTLSHLLHPPMMDEAGLATAALWYVEGFGERSGLNVSLYVPEDLPRFPDSVEVVLFRVLQEALTNVYRHSGASQIDVEILHDAEQVTLKVEDNGCGIPEELLARFNASGSGMGIGLSGMRERVRELGGALAVKSAGKGTSVWVAVPVASARSGDSESLTDAVEQL